MTLEYTFPPCRCVNFDVFGRNLKVKLMRGDSPDKAIVRAVEHVKKVLIDPKNHSKFKNGVPDDWEAYVIKTKEKAK